MVGPETLTNAGEIIEALGQAWTLSHVGPEIRGAFSAWLKGRARQELSEQRRQGILGQNDYRENLAILNAEFAAGSYSWGSPQAREGMGEAVAVALGSLDGKVQLVQLLLKGAHGEVPYEKIHELNKAEPDQLGDAIAVCLDPNRKSPATPKEAPGTKTKEEAGGATVSPTATASPS